MTEWGLEKERIEQVQKCAEMEGLLRPGVFGRLIQAYVGEEQTERRNSFLVQCRDLMKEQERGKVVLGGRDDEYSIHGIFYVPSAVGQHEINLDL